MNDTPKHVSPLEPAKVIMESSQLGLQAEYFSSTDTSNVESAKKDGKIQRIELPSSAEDVISPMISPSKRQVVHHAKSQQNPKVMSPISPRDEPKPFVFKKDINLYNRFISTPQDAKHIVQPQEYHQNTLNSNKHSFTSQDRYKGFGEGQITAPPEQSQFRPRTDSGYSQDNESEGGPKSHDKLRKASAVHPGHVQGEYFMMSSSPGHTNRRVRITDEEIKAGHVKGRQKSFTTNTKAANLFEKPEAGPIDIRVDLKRPQGNIQNPPSHTPEPSTAGRTFIPRRIIGDSDWRRMNKAPPSAVYRNANGNISSPQQLSPPPMSPRTKPALTSQTSSSTNKTVDSSVSNASTIRRGSFLLSKASRQSDGGRRESLKAGVVTTGSMSQVATTSPEERDDSERRKERVPVVKPRARSPWRLWKLGNS